MDGTGKAGQQGAAATAGGDPRMTELIAAWHAGDAGARDALIECAYANVRAIAAQSLRRMPGATLSTTDLAHEALLRILGADASWADRRHFFHVVAQATRQLLVDAARRRLAGKRGAGAVHVELDETRLPASPQTDAALLQLDEALAELARTDPRPARAIELVYFGGLTRGEVARHLGISAATVDRDLRTARAWLRSALEDDADADPDGRRE